MFALSTVVVAVALFSGALAAPAMERRQAPAANAAPLTDPTILNVVFILFSSIYKLTC